MSILKVFNNQFKEFITDILIVFPEDTNVKTAKFYVENLMRVNPSLIIKAWHEYVTAPYLTEINAGDFRFFLSKNYESDVGISENYDSENVLGAIRLIKTKAQQMSEENTTKIIKYLQNLTKLSIMYINKK